MIGIMTFHAAYNFGSSFQAYATIKILKKLGFENEIINYRLDNQIHYYGDVITIKFGVKDFLRRVICLRELKDRKVRAKRYETFIADNLVTSGRIFHKYEDFESADIKYDVLIAGSDQIWNKHCTAEFKTEPLQSILPYFLDFCGDKDIKRISFSSSFGFMKEDEVKFFLPQLSKFQYLSIREKDGAEMLSKLLGTEVVNTIDPTLLLNRDQWLSDFKSGFTSTNYEYILIYSLEKSIKKLKRIQTAVMAFAKGKKVICLSPFLSTHPAGIIMRNDSGPIQFLSLLSSAECMVTDSFHGTAFSVNLGVPFYCLNTGKDNRKRLLLERVGLEDQLIDSIDVLSTKCIPEIDFVNTWKNLDAMREESLHYLRKALSN